MLRRYPPLLQGIIRYTPSQITIHKPENKAIQKTTQDAKTERTEPRFEEKKSEAAKKEQERIWREYSVY